MDAAPELFLWAPAPGATATSESSGQSADEDEDEDESRAADPDDDHLAEVADGAGCAEIWEHLSERREE